MSGFDVAMIVLRLKEALRQPDLRRRLAVWPSGTGIRGVLAGSPRVKADWVVTNVDRRNGLGCFLVRLSDTGRWIRGHPLISAPG